MTHVWTIAKKELRAAFGSPVALIFLATFLGVVMFTFFWKDAFFSRGAADLRPMFDWMPVLLIFLVASLSMRMWSEEQKAGTIEVLLTLPVPHWQLVVGKFLAGLALVGIALLLTLGLPITVSFMGNLDWGPVVGGYLAALLLAAAYLSIGMCVSAATDSQIVSLIATALVCGLLYLPGTSQLADQAGMGAAQVMRGIGSGSRFASVARGVLDLRDLAYYGSLVVVFLGVNVLLLARHRWSEGARTRPLRRNAQIAVALAAANAIALNLWLAPVQARVDLTSEGSYSLSPTTEKILANLDEPLTIRAYFSEKTHPLLAPLVPVIKDLLEEYRTVGGSKVRVEVIDPSKDVELEKEAKEQYGIESVPLRFASRTERSVLNAFFHILVSYGDQYQVLTFNDLIEVKARDVGEVEVHLKNLEYDLTKTIKKVTTGFQSVDALFASLPGKVTLTAYVTAKTLPENLKAAPAALDKVVEMLGKESGGKLDVKKVEPTGEAEMKALFTKWGLRPYGSVTGEVYYFHLLLDVGGRVVRVAVPETVTETSLRTALTEALKRAAPGFTKVVGLWTPPAPPPMPMMQGAPPQQMPPPQGFETLKRALGETYEVRPVELAARVPDDIDVLLLAGPAGLDDKAAQQVDQFLMRGGAVIALAGQYRLDVMGSRGQLSLEKVSTGLDALLTSWGVQIKDTLVLDEDNQSFPIPVERDLGGGVRVRDVAEVPYPYFVHVPQDRLATGNAITAGLPGAVMHWASPLNIEPSKGTGRKVDVLVRSSDASWLEAKTSVQPDFEASKTGFAKPANLTPDQKGSQVLAVAVTGGFPSWAVGKKKADEATGAKAEDEGQDGGEGDKAGKEPLIEQSSPDARLVVIGSSAFATDDVLQLAQQLGAEVAAANVQLVQNAVDWAVADTDLLAIRARTSAARALTVPEAERGKWEWINYGLAFAGLGVVVLVMWLRRRSIKPLVSAEVPS